MTEAERRLAAQSFPGRFGVVAGVLMQLTPWDLLWFGLALVAAYRMMARRKVPEPEVGRL